MIIIDIPNGQKWGTALNFFCNSLKCIFLGKRVTCKFRRAQLVIPWRNKRVAWKKEIMQGTMPGACWHWRPHTAWVDNTKTWTGLPMEESVRMTEDRDKWRKYVHGVANPQIEDSWRNRTEQLVYEHTIYFRFHSQKQHRRQSRGGTGPPNDGVVGAPCTLGPQLWHQWTVTKHTVFTCWC